MVKKGPVRHLLLLAHPVPGEDNSDQTAMYTVQCTLYNCKLYSILSYDIGIPYLHVLKNFKQMIILLSMIVHLKLESSGMLAIIGIAAMLRCLW